MGRDVCDPTAEASAATTTRVDIRRCPYFVDVGARVARYHCFRACRARARASELVWRDQRSSLFRGFVGRRSRLRGPPAYRNALFPDLGKSLFNAANSESVHQHVDQLSQQLGASGVHVTPPFADDRPARSRQRENSDDVLCRELFLGSCAGRSNSWLTKPGRQEQKC